MPKLNPLLEISLILVITLAALTFFSFSEKNYKLMLVELKKPAIKEFLTAKNQNSHEKKVLALAEAKKNKEIDSLKDEKVLDTTSQRILMVGESMIEGLMFPFKKYATHNKHKLLTKIWYGSRFMDWAKDDTLKKIIEKFKPSYILVSIGSNELFVRNIEERDTFVKSIVQQLGDHKFIWIGPPIPRKDNGISKLITDNVGEDRYFVSKYMKFKRKRDGVHPKPESSRVWADSIANWIMNESRYPILLNDPKTITKDSTIAVKTSVAAKPSNS
jgi:hypothetical protein